jgi:hypothetical protein
MFHLHLSFGRLRLYRSTEDDPDLYYSVYDSRTVLSEIGFPSNAVATKCAPHGRQGLLVLHFEIERSASCYQMCSKQQMQSFSTSIGNNLSTQLILVMNNGRLSI